ncbi:MAG: hypothetical protein ACLR5G_17080 [Eubacteriales bacterium]
MTRYILGADLTDEICEKTSFRPNRSWLADKMPYAPSDDDTNYTVLAGVLIDKYGRDFTLGTSPASGSIISRRTRTAPRSASRSATS